MLFLTFQIGADRYALEARQIVEVLPLVHVKAIPGSARGVVGIFNYHGKPVPLLDLAELALGLPCAARMSTRIIVTNYEHHSGQALMLGLKAEHVTETIRRAAEEFVDSGVAAKDAPYLGPVTLEAEQIIQRLDVARLLTEDVLAQLCRQAAESS